MSQATLRARFGVTAATLIAGLGLTLLPVLTATASASPTRPSASATSMQFGMSQSKAPHRRSSAHARMVQRYDHKVRSVLHEARRQRGKPYSYGAAGPHAFDCSGLVRYVYGHSVQRWLPHNAAQQYHSVKHVKRSNLRKGDLIFTDNGSITHVGIFAGHHHWWVAPHTGTHVQLQRIYHAHFVYGRVLVLHHN
jgi:cell wall-associated NlpC family hydrolase